MFPFDDVITQHQITQVIADNEMLITFKSPCEVWSLNGVTDMQFINQSGFNYHLLKFIAHV